MSITEADAQRVIEASGFSPTHATAKVVEFTSARSARTLYLRLGQGFPQHADVVINPEVAISTLLSIPGIKPNPRVELRFGSNMKAFPMARNSGAELEHYGRAFQAASPEALSALCRAYAAVP